MPLNGRMPVEPNAAARVVFLAGALGAVFSSLLGVWQAVPYLFADVWRLFLRTGSATGTAAPVDTRSVPYRAYLVAMTFLPMLALPMSFREVQKLYAVLGAVFIPLLAAVLLALNGRRAWVGHFVNRWPTTAVLAAALGFSAWFVWLEWIA